MDESLLISQRDNVAVGLCLFFYLVGMFAMSVFETLATTLAMDEFGQSTFPHSHTPNHLSNQESARGRWWMASSPHPPSAIALAAALC